MMIAGRHDLVLRFLNSSIANVMVSILLSIVGQVACSVDHVKCI